MTHIITQISYPLQSTEYCQAAYGGDYRDGMICAGLESGGVGWCNGDMGAPLMCEADSLTGLSSWGQGCGVAGYPDIFTNTLYFSQWIIQHLDR